MSSRDLIEVDLVGFARSGGWQIVVWSDIENLKGDFYMSAVLIQTLDRSRSWIFKDIGEAFKFCFENGFVPVDEIGNWDHSGDLMAGMNEAEPVPLIAWRRLWKKDAPDDSPEYQSPEWPTV